MTTDGGSTVLALPPELADEREPSALADVRTHVDPDLVLLPGPDRRPQAAARVRGFFDVPVAHPPLGGADGAVQEHAVGSVRFVFVQRAAALSAVTPGDDGRSSTAGDRDVILVCDDVVTTVDRTTLDASLDHAGAVVDCVPSARRIQTVLSGRLPADYDRCWLVERGDGSVRSVRDPAELRSAVLSTASPDCVWLRIRGVGSIDDYSGAGTVVSMEIAARGQPDDDPAGERPGASDPWPIRAVESIGADAFGIRAVDGVGAKTARALAERGIRSKAHLLETPASEVAALPGLGENTARRMREHARVLDSGEPRRLTTESLPGETDADPPLCLDIETDGLSPTIIWQIGVYDPRTDDYRAFVERTEPTEPGAVIESFIEWLFGVHPDRTLLTWNGWRFDYKHLESFVGRYSPAYHDPWGSIAKRDLYRWAVTDENAVLPGRTNGLDDVADALGFDGAETGLDGATTAAAYSRFIRTGDPLAWDRHERYCEDDCRALWAVYEALAGAPVAGLEQDPTPAGQTGLGDF